jgi:ethanolamine utilization protein EutQ
MEFHDDANHRKEVKGMKKLICVKDIEALEKQGKKIFHIDGDTIITPSAKDAARLGGIEFSYEAECCAEKSSCCEEKASMPEKTTTGEIDSNMIYTVLKAMLEKGMLGGMFDNNSNQPYYAESDCGGLKLVRGSSVKMDVFDTGNPDNKVFYQELISKDDAKMSAGFLTIEKSSFDWELCYEEIDYVIDGTLTVTLNGKTFTACAGDVLFVPSGSKVTWGSPDKARVFYTTYPANWADLMAN